MQTRFSGQTDMKSIKPCRFCGEQHVSSNCTIVTDVHSRKSVKAERYVFYMQSFNIKFQMFCPSKSRLAFPPSYFSISDVRQLKSPPIQSKESGYNKLCR